MAELKVAYTSIPQWPHSGQSSRNEADKKRPCRIAVMDSCYNPPTLAHYRLLTHSSTSFDAHLLLLSSLNVDKTHSEGDTSLSERLAMMELLAKRAQRDEGCERVGAASLAAATFADKAPIILDWLEKQHTGTEQKYTLVFFIGFDTVTRLFAKRYYKDSEAEMERILEKFFVTDGCEVICARRPVAEVAQKDVQDQEEEELVGRPLVRRYIEQGKLEFVDVQGTGGVSSTKIRNILKERGEGGDEGVREKLKGLCHDEIVDYCLEKGLYRQ